MLKFKKLISLVVIILFAVVIFTGCSNNNVTKEGSAEKAQPAQEEKQEEKNEEPKEKNVVGVSMDTVDHPFWQADVAGMKDKAKELGIELDIQVAQGDANVQNKQIEERYRLFGSCRNKYWQCPWCYDHDKGWWTTWEFTVWLVSCRSCDASNGSRNRCYQWPSSYQA